MKDFYVHHDSHWRPGMDQDTLIHTTLKESFGLESFRNSQVEAIRHTLGGGNSLVLMPTGMGKSLCYQLPALLLDGLTVVISPLIALMKDQVDSLKKRGIDAVFINSSLGKSERENRYDGIRSGRYRLVFVSPERFQKSTFLEVIQTRTISLLAVDEAHCVSQWGNDFRPDYARVHEFRAILGNPVTMALTATATRRVQLDIIEKLGFKPDEIRIFNEGISRPNLHLSVINVLDNVEKFEEILELIEEFKGTAVIYFSLIKSLEEFSSHLSQKHIKHMVYHGKMPSEKREYIQRKFMNSSNSVMLATNAFGMGVDKADIRLIIHAEIPDSIESYYQEIGRAGRDGKPSEAVLIYNEADLGIQLNFMEWRNPDVKMIRTTFNMIQELGSSLHSLTYEDLQEKLVYKNRGDHRLRTILNLFDRFHVTSGSIDLHNLSIENELPESLVSLDENKLKRETDQNRLYQMLQYVKTAECRRDFIHNYFNISNDNCDNCDNCSDSG
jgi:ATP-dependent DNA helicase RecQ